MVVRILLWNTQGIKMALELLLAEAKYDVLSVQEPWINKQTKSTYCPRNSKYHLIHSPGGRAALYISKKYPVHQWEYEASENWCRVWFHGSPGLEIWSVYNPPANKTIPEALLQRPTPTLPTVVSGDFNLHHPLWDQYERLEPQADSLLQLALQWELDLRTPKGTITRAPQGRQRGRPSTIDHFWVSTSLKAEYYGSDERGKSDHYPQVLEVDHGLQRSEVKLEGWSWKKMNKHRVAAEANLLPLALGLEDPGPQGLHQRIQTRDGLDKAFDLLVQELTRIAASSTPEKKPNRGFGAYWWTSDVQEATRASRRAERRYREVPSDYLKAQLNRELKSQAKTVAYAKTKAWRTTLQNAAGDTELLWKLERWARCKSFVPVDPPKLPALNGPQGQVLSTHEQKATALSDRFFPNPPANLTDIEDVTFAEAFDTPDFDICREVSEDEVADALSSSKPWRAPGNDLLPTGFLKACGPPLHRILAALATRCFQLEWFPARLKQAKTVVLAKPGKTPAAYKTPAGYRPIALLPAIGKAIEAILAGRITQAAELHNLLPDEQMGNRRGRSTELAVRLVVSQVQEAWRQKATASLLQLDVSGAFDTVNHIRLLHTLREMGFPGWIVRWTKAWLTDRQATLHFDGKATPPIPVKAGVPQGSPLSPILFILYIASLYEVIKEKHPHIGLVGFADDTNLLAFGRSPEANNLQLQEAWKTCLQWAETRGMVFAAEKSELIHFNKGRTQWPNAVKLQSSHGVDCSTVKPVASARFLGIWLDRKLSWKAHKEAVNKKLRTQEFALSRIAAKTWGPGLIRAREVYTKCIRSAIAYGASSFHTPTPVGGKPRGIATSLTKAQNRSLRIVAGAYKATPIRSLETETWVPPLDLYLNKRVADFERRIQTPFEPTSQRTPGSIIQKARNKVAERFRNLRRRGRRRRPQPQEPTPTERAATAVEVWASQGSTTEEALEIAWKNRWDAEYSTRRRGSPDRRLRTTQPADDNPQFSDKTLRVHSCLKKAESSLLVQARTGAIGLRDFLFRTGVRGVATPYCDCGTGRETVEHLVVWCPNPPKPKTWTASEIRSRRDLHKALQGGGRGKAALARAVVSWLLSSGRLPEYRLARKLELEQ
jgi:exonuclease III